VASFNSVRQSLDAVDMIHRRLRARHLPVRLAFRWWRWVPGRWAGCR